MPLPATRKDPHRPPTGAPAGAYIVRAPGAPRRFPARFRGIFRVPPLPGAAPRSGRGGVLASPQHPVQKNSVVSSRRPKHLFLPRAVPRNVPRPATFWRAPRSGRGGVLASPQHPVQKNSVVSSRRPKHLFYTLRGGTKLGPEVLTSSRRAATRARSTNFAKASRPRKNLPSLSHNHFGERRGAGSESFGTDTCGTDASGAVALFSAAP